MKQAQRTEQYELRICDGYGSSRSIFKQTTFDVACDDLHKMGSILKTMTDVGRIELRGQDDKLVEAIFFTAAEDRAKARRQAARVAAFRESMYAAGLDDEDLRV